MEVIRIYGDILVSPKYYALHNRKAKSTISNGLYYNINEEYYNGSVQRV